MRLCSILTGLLLAALLAGQGLAQSPGDIKLRGKFTTPTLTATPSQDPGLTDLGGLRGPLSVDGSAPLSGAPSAPRWNAGADDESTRAPVAMAPAPPLGVHPFAGGFSAAAVGGLPASGLPALPSMTPVGDPAPICRAQCSKARAFCPSDDDPGCDSQWAQCIAACSTASAQ